MLLLLLLLLLLTSILTSPVTVIPDYRRDYVVVVVVVVVTITYPWVQGLWVIIDDVAVDVLDSPPTTYHTLVVSIVN